MKLFCFFTCALSVTMCEPCPPLEVMFLQDTTQSWEGNLSIVIEQLPALLNTMQTKYKVSRMGVAEARDKPMAPFGDKDVDFCYRLGDFGPLSKKRSDVMYAYNRLYAEGGGDRDHAQMQSLIDVNSDLRVGWSEGSRRLIILVTKTWSHMPGRPEFPEGRPNHNRPKPFRSDEADKVCLEEDYPYPSGASENLAKTNTSVIFLHPDESVHSWSQWSWIVKEFSKTEGLAQVLEEDASNFFSSALAGLEAYHATQTCDEPEETTMPADHSGEETAITEDPLRPPRPYNTSGGAELHIVQLQKRVILTVDN